MSVLLDILREVGPTGAVDILIMAAIVYGGLIWLRRSRTVNALRGALIIGGLYLLARQFNLVLTSAALEAFFVVLLVAAVVIFRNELRRVVERVAAYSRRRTSSRGAGRSADSDVVAALATTLRDLARAHTGALLVLEGSEPVEPYLEGGTPLDGELSEPLLKSIFDDHSMGHDGAVIVRQGRVLRFATHLPLSTNFEMLQHRGTRHAAALGLAERSDAMCLVVSEERGEISVAQDGAMQVLDDVDPATLQGAIDAFVSKSAPKPRSWGRALRSEAPAALAALAIALLLWFVLVHGGTVTQRTFTVPVQYADLPAQHGVAAIKPTTVQMTFAGPRRDFYFLSKANLKLVLPLRRAKAGTRVVHLTPLDVSYPAGLTLKTIEPSHVVLHIAPRKVLEQQGK